MPDEATEMRVLMDLFQSGRAGEMGPAAHAVYWAIRLFADPSDGSIPLTRYKLSEKLGITHAETLEAFERLEAMGLLTSRREERRKVYALAPYRPAE